LNTGDSVTSSCRHKLLSALLLSPVTGVGVWGLAGMSSTGGEGEAAVATSTGEADTSGETSSRGVEAAASDLSAAV